MSSMKNQIKAYNEYFVIPQNTLQNPLMEYID